MERKEFLNSLLSLSTLGPLHSLKKFTDQLPIKNPKMPVLFIGHGSPMNGIEHNSFSESWEELGKKLPTPTAVLVISAHWLTKGTFVTAMDTPKTIHDFGGFPKQLYDVQYPAKGNPELARETAKLVSLTNVGLDHDWGLDHGTWTVVRHMYPQANIPVLQLSIDYYKPAQFHYDLAKELTALRYKGVLIIGSGNMIHNLRMISWENMNGTDYGYDWALEMNRVLKQKINDKDHKSLIDYSKLGSGAQLAIPTPDHYFPLLYSLGLEDKSDQISFFNDKLIGGSLNMTSVLLS
jgi:4,5-DOPA dioxygenase extradiol